MLMIFLFFFFNDTAPTEIYTLSLHDALPIWLGAQAQPVYDLVAPQQFMGNMATDASQARSEEHTSELQSRLHLVCRLLLEKKKKKCLEPHLDQTQSTPEPSSPHQPTYTYPTQ